MKTSHQKFNTHRQPTTKGWFLNSKIEHMSGLISATIDMDCFDNCGKLVTLFHGFNNCAYRYQNGNKNCGTALVLILTKIWKLLHTEQNVYCKTTTLFVQHLLINGIK